MKNTFCSLKICLIFFFFFTGALGLLGQTITVQPVVSTELNLLSEISLWVSAPVGQEVNAQCYYFTDMSDTLSTDVISNTSLGVSYQFVFGSIIVDCDSLWLGYVDVWISGQDTIQSNQISWSLPCPGDVSISLPTVSLLEGVGVEYSLAYNSGGAVADLYWYTSVNGEPLTLNTVEVFGSGFHVDTLFLSGGQSYQICFPEIINPVSVEFIPGCVSGEVPEFEAVLPVAELSAFYSEEGIETNVTIVNSGDLSSEFSIVWERFICGFGYEVYEETQIIFDELVIDSVLALPQIVNLPQSPSWRVTLNGANSVGEVVEQSVVIEISDGSAPLVTLDVFEQDGNFVAEAVWDDQGAGNVIVSFFVNGVLVESMQVQTNLVAYMGSVNVYTETVVEVVVTSNACISASAYEVLSACTPPSHILETVTQVTSMSAIAHVSFVDFYGCVEDAMVGIILLDQDTIWTSQTVNTFESSNYLIMLGGLNPNTTYIYQAVLYASGQYFTTNFTLSFTTESDDPVNPFFTNFFVNWDEGMIATVFANYNLGDGTSAGLRIWHNPPGSQQSVILDVVVSNQSLSFDHVVSLYGTHAVWIELYDTETNVVYQTTDVSIHTYQPPPVSVSEIGHPVDRFDFVTVYDNTGRTVALFSKGEILNFDFSNGIYLFVGRKGNLSNASKIYLGY